jgi:hypothetical protein
MKNKKESNSIKNNILSLRPFSSKDYENIDLDRLVIFTMCFLERKGLPLYFDFISVALFKLFPEKFSMANFIEFPDTYRINNSIRRTTGSLSDRDKLDRWANGTSEHGFSLTETGKEISKQVLMMLNNPKSIKTKNERAYKTRGKSLSDDILEIYDSDIFKKWQDEEEISDYDVLAFLKATSFTPKELIYNYLCRLKKSVNRDEHELVVNFLIWIEKRLNKIFN